MSDDVPENLEVEDDEDGTDSRSESYLQILGDQDKIDNSPPMDSPTRRETRMSAGGSMLEDSRTFAAEFVHSTQIENEFDYNAITQTESETYFPVITQTESEETVFNAITQTESDMNTDYNVSTKDTTVEQQELDHDAMDTLDTTNIAATTTATTTATTQNLPDVTVNETETDSLLAQLPETLPDDNKPQESTESTETTDTPPAPKKPRAFMVCAFEIGKPVTRETMTRMDVLELARNTLLPQLSLRFKPKHHKHSPHPKPSNPRANAQGARRLHTRDLRKLDLGSGKTEPIIMARLDAIIVMIPPIRAVILAHKCLVFVNEGADSEIAPLYDWLDGDSHDTHPAPFELKALEAVLEAVFLDRRREVKGLVSSKKLVLESVVKKSSPQDLNKLRALKNETNKCVARAQALSRLVRGILDQEEDMAMMRLTATKKVGNDLDTEDVELLLENYLQDSQEVQRSLEGIVGEIDATERMVEIQLDTARNTLLLYGFVLSVVTAACSVASMFFGAFGMNLESGLEDSRDNFRLVFGILMAFVVISPVTLLMVFHHRGMLT